MTKRHKPVRLVGADPWLPISQLKIRDLIITFSLGTRGSDGMLLDDIALNNESPKGHFLIFSVELSDAGLPNLAFCSDR